MIRVKCHVCGRTTRGGDDWAGRQVRCLNCGETLFMPPVEKVAPDPALPSIMTAPPRKSPEVVSFHFSMTKIGAASLAFSGILAVIILAWIRAPHSRAIQDTTARGQVLGFVPKLVFDDAYKSANLGDGSFTLPRRAFGWLVCC